MKTTDSIIPGAMALLLAASCAPAGEVVCFDAVTAGRIDPPMEAVAATNAPPEIREKIVKGASGGRYLELARIGGKSPDERTGSAAFKFEIPADGEYFLWCRTWWTDECGNSFFMNVDDAKPFVFGEDSTFKSWHWVRAPLRLKQLGFTRGSHTLTVRNREYGVRLNQVLLTADRKYVPVDVEPVTAGAAQ